MRKSQAKFLDHLLVTILPIAILVWIVAGVVWVFAGSSDMDPSFDTGIPIGFGSSWPTTMALQPDGKLIVGGSFPSYQWKSASHLVRINKDWTVDTAFNSEAAFNRASASVISTIKIQTNGKVLIGGTFQWPQWRGLTSMERLNADGSIDTSFSTWVFDGVYSMLDIETQSNWNIVAIWPFSTYNWMTSKYIVGLLPDGTRNFSFNSWGVGFNNYVYGIEKQSDDKLILWGDFSMYNGEAANGIIRLNPDWSRDRSFDVIWDGLSTKANTIKLQDDGKLLILGGTSFNGQALWPITRFNTDGSLDTGFDGISFWAPYASNQYNGIASLFLQKDGKIVILWSYSNDNGVTWPIVSMRINADGSLDNSFDIWSGFDKAFGMWVTQDDDKMIFGGQFRSYQNVAVNGLVRVNSDWTRDTSFNIWNGLNTPAQSIAAQNDGKVILAGLSATYKWQIINGVTRLNIDGNIDNSFDIWSWFDKSPNFASIQDDGKIIVAGNFSSYKWESVGKVVRLLPDGTRDPSFDSTNAIDSTSISSVIIQADGKILVLGYTDYANSQLVRLNTDGSVDFAKTPYRTHKMALQPDGKIVLVSSDWWTNTDVVYRMNADGTEDTTFNAALSSYHYVRTNNRVEALTVQNDGKILIGWQFQEVNWRSLKNIARINSDGSMDTWFVIGSSFDYDVSAILANPDGTILVWGPFTSYKGVPTNNIVELNNDWSRNIVFDFWIGFGVGPIVRGNITNIIRQTDWGILIGGNFTKYKSAAAGYLIRLYWDAPAVQLPNSTDTTTVNSAFTDKWYVETNGTLVGSAPISLGITDGSIPTQLNLSNDNINLSILADTQAQDKNSINYNWLISLPVTKNITSVSDEVVIASFNVGSNSDLITLAWGWAVISMPVPGQTIGNSVNVYYSNDNGVNWYFETTTQVIDKDGTPYVEFTTDHFGDFAITIPGHDLTAPSITLNWAEIIDINLGNQYDELWATASDNKDWDISPNIVISGTVNTNVEWTYIISYNVSDAAGNKATEVTRTIHVILDKIPPVITLVGDAVINLFQGDSYSEVGATALDDIDWDISANIITSWSVNTNVEWTYTITYNVSDAAGNQAIEVVRTVNVTADHIPPVITLIGDSVINLFQGDVYIEDSATANDDTDWDISANITTSGSVNINTTWSYIITYNVSDVAGNKATEVTRTVNIIDIALKKNSIVAIL